MQSFVDKLIILTNSFIEADDNNNAREIRDRLIDEVFPQLTSKEKRDFSDFTELIDISRTLKQRFGKNISEEDLMIGARQIVAALRLAEQRQRDSIQNPYGMRLPRSPE
jgi:hypothetical protein